MDSDIGEDYDSNLGEDFEDFEEEEEEEGEEEEEEGDLAVKDGTLEDPSESVVVKQEIATTKVRGSEFITRYEYARLVGLISEYINEGKYQPEQMLVGKSLMEKATSDFDNNKAERLGLKLKRKVGKFYVIVDVASMRTKEEKVRNIMGEFHTEDMD